MKKTDWYPADVKPVRVGWYEKDFGPKSEFPHNAQFWNGRRWLYGSAGRFNANEPDTIDLVPISRPWRGLTEPQS